MVRRSLAARNTSTDRQVDGHPRFQLIQVPVHIRNFLLQVLQERSISCYFVFTGCDATFHEYSVEQYASSFFPIDIQVLLTRYAALA